MTLRTFLIVLTAICIVIGSFIYYSFSQDNAINTLGPTPLSKAGEPRFLFNIYGARDVKFIRPMAVYFDVTDKLIYVANTEGHRIDVFKEQGEYVFSFGQFGAEPGQLSFPYGIARLPSGDLMVAESGNGRVQRFSAKGEYLGTLFTQPNEYKIEKPGPLHIDSRGNIYIGDISGAKVVVIDEQGKTVRTLSQVPYPHGIAVDEKNNRVLVASAGAKTVFAFDWEKDINQGRPIEFKGKSGDINFGVIRGIAVDRWGRIFVVDSLTGLIRVFDAEGGFQFALGGTGYDDGNLLYPNGIFIGQNDKIYVADWANHRVAIWGY